MRRWLAGVGAIAAAVNAEGVRMFEGYVKPLYLMPIFQQKRVFKHGYPFSAPENAQCLLDYNKGLCPNAEQLYNSEMLINEHIRPPHTIADIEDVVLAIHKVLGS